MPRINLSAGPSKIPAPVAERIKADIPNWHDCGANVFEISHRSPAFIELAERLVDRFRRLIGLDAGWDLMLMHGGASAQFALLPMNFLGEDDCAWYMVDGHWGRKAWDAGRVLGQCERIERSKHRQKHVADRLGQAKYLHCTSNETIDGKQWLEPPRTDAPVFCDMSSDILGVIPAIDRYTAFYAGAQKNLGVAGVTFVAMRCDWIDKARKSLPPSFSYSTQAAGDSMVNTPATFAWYVADLVCEWIEVSGGLPAMAARNQKKANALYQAIDTSPFFSNDIDGSERSVMNVVFRTPTAELDQRFVAESEAAGFMGLKGHRAIGGLRASIYNAVTPEEVDYLIDFMAEFERTV